MPDIALITIHGMGNTKENYHLGMVQGLQRKLDPAHFNAVHIGRVYYQGFLQANEQKVWDAVSRRVQQDALRKFVLFGIADAAGLESNKTDVNSAYTMAQLEIAKTLYAAFEQNPDMPVVILAHSLGCQAASCYFWDAKLHKDGKPVDAGIWAHLDHYRSAITGSDTPLSDQALAFLRGERFCLFMTTGCNIPIFVAAHAREDILPIKPSANFVWHNYYDKDDVLGWPLADLSDEYRARVQDHVVNAGGGVLATLLESWNPMSHTRYWHDDEILTPLSNQLRQLLT